MGLFDLFQSNLCTEKQLYKIGNRFSDGFIKRAENSTYALILAAEYTQGVSENSISPELFFMSLRKKINMNSFSARDFADFQFPVETTGMIATTTKFLYYYITRLPIVLRGTTYQKQQFSKKERNYITNCCLKQVYASRYSNNYYLNMPYQSMQEGYDFAEGLRSEREKMEYINDYHIFIRGREGHNEILESIKYLNDKDKFLFFSMLDEYFSIFYQSYQDILSELIFSIIVCPMEKERGFDE